ncbi:hypothetical protein ACFL1J_08025 [Pseudomonadota bacterium]
MKWLQDNLLGMILAATSGVFVLLALGMAIVWNLPVSIESAGVESENTSGNDTSLAARKIGTLADYQVVNDKPVFNESRRPVIAELEDGSGPDGDTIEVKDAPDVRLTGVVITSSMKIASLTPADGNLETVMAHEGESLTGEFVGWQVTLVNPRNVVLESRDGQSLELDLQIHDTKIQEPPKPVKPQPAAQAASDQDTEAAGEDDEPLSRAEQIRQRIAERREELRLEQEAQQSQDEAPTAAARKRPQPSNYQQAVRALMNKKSKDQGSNDNDDG